MDMSMTTLTLWEKCLNRLRDDISSKTFSTWIRPLHARENKGVLHLLAPNQYVLNWVKENYLEHIQKAMSDLTGAETSSTIVKLEIGTYNNEDNVSNSKDEASITDSKTSPLKSGKAGGLTSNINQNYTFDNFIEGKSNQLARAAAWQVSQNPGQSYNPLFIYGGVGLGKTHLTHAMGNFILKDNPDDRILYIHSERFVADMIKALQRNEMNEFKRYYRSPKCLIIDDIQFFAGKERSQEELFHTVNSLLDEHQQIILTCDRYPKEINGLEERLKSRFGWGLTIGIEPPEFETRVAILMSKAELTRVNLPQEVAFFIAKHIQSNVRELEGALKRVIANSQFTGQPITVEFAREALKDLLILQAKLVTIENIQKTVADYYKVKVSELMSKRRTRSVARPRQMAMALAKELTSHSLPEIGESFGGRDHTTVLHACRKIKELIASGLDVQEDYKNLLRILSA